MTRPIALRVFCQLALVALALAGPSAAQADGGSTPRAKLHHLRQMLNETIDMKYFQAPMSLKEALGLIQDKLNARYNLEDAMPVLVDARAFIGSPKDPDIYESPVKFPPFPRQMSVAAALKVALSQVPSRNATFLLRNGFVEITTLKEASRERLLEQKVFANFERRFLREALQDLAALTGVSVTADVRLSDELNTQVTASFNNDITLEAALRLLANMADLKLVLADGGVYITSAENAQAMEKEARARREPRQAEQARPEAGFAPAPGGGAKAPGPSGKK
jgi:hypothetical protein